jgi:hypothetical protein
LAIRTLARSRAHLPVLGIAIVGTHPLCRGRRLRLGPREVVEIGNRPGLALVGAPVDGPIVAADIGKDRVLSLASDGSARACRYYPEKRVQSPHSQLGTWRS